MELDLIARDELVLQDPIPVVHENLAVLVPQDQRTGPRIGKLRLLDDADGRGDGCGQGCSRERVATSAPSQPLRSAYESATPVAAIMLIVRIGPMVVRRVLE